MVITHDEFRSPNDLRNLRIWLPDNYWQTEERFPVTYFLDGQWVLGDPTPPTDPPADNAAEKDARRGTASAAHRRKEPKPVAAQTRRGLCMEDYLRTWHKPMIVVGVPSPACAPGRTARQPRSAASAWAAWRLPTPPRHATTPSRRRDASPPAPGPGSASSAARSPTPRTIAG